jgi:hypothetical protein
MNSRWLAEAAAVILLAGFPGCGGNEPNPDSGSTAQIPHVTAATETAVMARLVSIATAELAYQTTSDGSFATIEELLEKGFLMSDPSQGKFAQAYKIELVLKPYRFELTATPVKYPITGRRSFFVDESRVIRAADRDGQPATASDPPIN